jgi:hypothetical protein
VSLDTLPAQAAVQRALASTRAVTTAVVVVAFVARMVTFSGVGLRSIQGYDEGVYYAGAAALVSGRVPYQDFLFLHPPGVLLLLAPFAELGRLTSDSFGLSVARVTFWALGALNAGLVARIAARGGQVPAAVAGLCYAVWQPAVYAERTLLLEGSGNTALLVALLLLGRTRTPLSGRAQLAAGAAMGAAACIKIWMVVPLGVLLGWQLLTAGRRAALRVSAGAAVAGVLILAPFLPQWRPMFRMVVTDQGERVREVAVVERLTMVAGLRPLTDNVPGVAVDLAVVAVCLLTAFAAVLAWSRPASRVHVVLLCASVAVLLGVPTMYDHYAAFAAAPFALVLGGAVAALRDRRRAQAITRGTPGAGGRALHRAAVPAALVLGVLLAVHVRTLAAPYGAEFPAAQLRPHVAQRPCLVTDLPMVPVLLDVLSRDLDRGCPLRVDVTGEEFDAYRERGPGGAAVDRSDNEAWQGLMQQYLTSGSSTVLARSQTGLSATTQDRLATLPVLARVGPYTVLGRSTAR